jgi:two-component system nitrate/nitrite response regulator NarL
MDQDGVQMNTSAGNLLGLRIRVLIVHPDRLFREALAVTVARHRRTMQVIGYVKAIDHIPKMSDVSVTWPDVILLGGAQTRAEIVRDVGQLRTLCPPAKVLVLSRPPVEQGAYRQHQEAVSSADVSLRRVLQTIQQLGRRQHASHPQSNPTDAIFGHPSKPAVQESVSKLILTRREQEILLLRRQGRSNKEIATDLHIELQTVKNHLRSLFTKAQHLRRTHAHPVTTAPSHS